MYALQHVFEVYMLISSQYFITILQHGIDHVEDVSAHKNGRISIYIHGVARDMMDGK